MRLTNVCNKHLQLSKLACIKGFLFSSHIKARWSHLPTYESSFDRAKVGTHRSQMKIVELSLVRSYLLVWRFTVVWVIYYFQSLRCFGMISECWKGDARGHSHGQRCEWRRGSDGLQGAGRALQLDPGLTSYSTFFLLPLFCVESIICLEGKINNPSSGKYFLSSVPPISLCHHLGLLKGFSSWKSVLWGPSTSLLRCFRNHR